MKLFNRLKLLLAWERAKGWLWLPFFLILLAFLLFQIISNSTHPSSLLDVIHDPVVSALAGAILGGAIAFYGSVYVQKAQVKSEAAIRRKNEIYTPLYDELIKIQICLHKNPCPDQFIYKIDQDPQWWPKLAVWPTFKNDSRGLQVPKQLANSLEEFTTLTEQYSATRSEACRNPQVEAEIKEILVRNFGKGFIGRRDLTSWFLPCSSDLTVLITELGRQAHMGNEPGRLYSDEELLVIAQEIFQKCTAIEIVVRNQSLRKKIDEKLQELIPALERVIRFINEHFEKQEKWF